MFEEDVDKILKLIRHPDNKPRHFDSIRKYVRLFYSKWSHLRDKDDKNKIKVMEEYLKLINQ